jgi:hypothetical protein
LDEDYYQAKEQAEKDAKCYQRYRADFLNGDLDPKER